MKRLLTVLLLYGAARRFVKSLFSPELWIVVQDVVAKVVYPQRLGVNRAPDDHCCGQGRMKAPARGSGGAGAIRPDTPCQRPCTCSRGTRSPGCLTCRRLTGSRIMELREPEWPVLETVKPPDGTQFWSTSGGPVFRREPPSAGAMSRPPVRNESPPRNNEPTISYYASRLYCLLDRRYGYLFHRLRMALAYFPPPR
jgi:hypothetical protein